MYNNKIPRFHFTKTLMNLRFLFIVITLKQLNLLILNNLILDLKEFGQRYLFSITPNWALYRNWLQTSLLSAVIAKRGGRLAGETLTFKCLLVARTCRPSAVLLRRGSLHLTNLVGNLWEMIKCIEIQVGVGRIALKKATFYRGYA